MQRIYLYGTKEGHLECKDCALNYDRNNLFSQGKNCVVNYSDRSGKKIIHLEYLERDKFYTLDKKETDELLTELKKHG